VKQYRRSLPEVSLEHDLCCGLRGSGAVGALFACGLWLCPTAISRTRSAVHPVSGDDDDSSAGDDDPRVSGGALLWLAEHLLGAGGSGNLLRIWDLPDAPVFPDAARRTGRCGAPGWM